MATCNANTRFDNSTIQRPGGFFSLLRYALEARKQRKMLEKLDETALCDIGLTRAEAEAEARRPIWDVPAGWRR